MLVLFSMIYLGGVLGAICYKRLWKLLIDRDMQKKDLRITAGLSTNVIAKLGKNQNISTEVLGKICKVLRPRKQIITSGCAPAIRFILKFLTGSIMSKLLCDAGMVTILCESFTGTKKSRPELDKLMKMVCFVDTVIMTRLDRMARSTRDGLDIIDELLGKGVEINILNMGKLDNSPSGKMMRTVIFSFAELREI